VTGEALAGCRFEVEVGPVAHGGHFVARHEGRVVFVRHALPGERVVVKVTEGDTESRFLRGDAVEVLAASSDRVPAPCPFSGPGRCGGCDFQHVALPAQRELKAAVVREQLSRLAGLDVAVTVEPVAGDVKGLDWRTRVRWAVDGAGRPGLRKHRSHEVLPVDDCRIAHPSLPQPGADLPRPVVEVETLRSSTGERLRLLTDRDGAVTEDGPPLLHERCGVRTFEVTGSGFWQVHPGAAEALVAAVLEALEPQPGERAADLYAGVGLFSAFLAERVGPSGSVVAVEADPMAVEDAARNLADLPQVRVLRGRVDRAVGHPRGPLAGGADVVVLDPPRTGARRPVVRRVAELAPRAVAYVACDPAALARDVGLFAEEGFRLAGLRAFDLFPMTHHVECVALLVR
jgi:tRNA/tmRNA/rRNA uracil-C5-methylase (TrmA/RlmC/RlmD family)